MHRWLPAAGISGLLFLAGIAGFPDAASAAAGENPTAATATPAAATPKPAAAQTGKASTADAPPAKAQPTRATQATARARGEAVKAIRSAAKGSDQRAAADAAKALRAARAARATAATKPAKAAAAPAAATKAARAKAAQQVTAAQQQAAAAAAAEAEAAPVTTASNHQTSVCHATGAGTFELITIATSALPAHLGHGDRLPVNGACPAAVPPPAAPPVTICHATGSPANPFELITIPASALPAHLGHGDRLPVNGACPGPGTPPAAPPVTICHATGSVDNPFELLTIPFSALPAHLGHGDRLPVNGACPGSGLLPAQDVAICHRTGSAANPFELLFIPFAALPAHLAHGDVLASGGSCAGAGVAPDDDDAGDDDEGDDEGDDDEVAAVVRTRSLDVVAQFVSVPIEVDDGLGFLPATGFSAAFAALVGLLLLLAGAVLTRLASTRAFARGARRASRFAGRGLHRRAGRVAALQTTVRSRFRVPQLLLQPSP